MGTRQRREARAARLAEWADKREAKAEATRAEVDQIAGMIPFGQPVLVGHHSERHARRDAERIHNRTGQAIEHARKAGEMRRKAASIEAAADKAIYSDDEDAVERLTERIAELEAERDRIKAYNASCRKGSPDLSLLDDKQRQTIEGFARFQPADMQATPKRGNAGGSDMHWSSCGCGWHKSCRDRPDAEASSQRHNQTKHVAGAVPFPAYALSGLSANINRNRKRLDALRARP